jgi:hypothetical protein
MPLAHRDQQHVRDANGADKQTDATDQSYHCLQTCHHQAQLADALDSVRDAKLAASFAAACGERFEHARVSAIAAVATSGHRSRSRITLACSWPGTPRRSP